MKHLAFLLVFVLLFSGCTQEEPAYAEPLAPAQEIPQTPQAIPQIHEEEIAVDEPPLPQTPPEENITEEEIIHWDVGVVEEIDEDERKLQAVEFEEGYALIVDDLTRDKPYPCAALRIGELEGANVITVFQDKVCPGEDTYWTSPQGDTYRIHVFETAAGYLGYAYWADVAVYKQWKEE